MKKYLFYLLVTLSLTVAHRAKARSIESLQPSSPGTATLVIHDPYLVEGEKLTLTYNRSAYSKVDPRSDTISITVQKNGTYRFTIPVKGICYIDVMKFKPIDSLNFIKHFNYMLLQNYLVRESDDIKMDLLQPEQFSLRNVKDVTRRFSGKGSLKYTVRNSIDSIIDHDRQGAGVLNDLTYTEDNIDDRVLTTTTRYLKQYMRALAPDDHYRLLADLVYLQKLHLQRLVLHAKGYKSKDPIVKRAFVTNYLNDHTGEDMGIPASVLANCQPFLEFQIIQTQISRENEGKTKDAYDLYHDLKARYQVPVRDGIIAEYFTRYNQTISKFPMIFQDAQVIVKDADALKRIRKYQNRMLGSNAYDFELSDTSGKLVRLSDFKGKVVFVDFWFTGCTFCKLFYKRALKEVEEEFRTDPNIVFLTICIDRSRPDWLKSIESGAYTSGNAINLYTGGKGNQHNVIKYYNVSSYPQPLVISKRQKVFEMTAEKLIEKESLVKTLKAALMEN